MVKRYAARRDDNEPDIVRALEKMGVSVTQMHSPCDLLIGFRGYTMLLEVKDGSKSPSRRHLTKDQREFFATYPGEAYVVESVDQAIAAVTRNGAHLALRAQDRAIKEMN